MSIELAHKGHVDRRETFISCNSWFTDDDDAVLCCLHPVALLSGVSLSRFVALFSSLHSTVSLFTGDVCKISTEKNVEFDPPISTDQLVIHGKETGTGYNNALFELLNLRVNVWGGKGDTRKVELANTDAVIYLLTQIPFISFVYRPTTRQFEFMLMHNSQNEMK